MEVVLGKEIIKRYFELLTPSIKTTNERLLINCIQNENIKFKFSKSYFELLESFFEKCEGNEDQLFKTFISSIGANDRTITVSNSEDAENDEKRLIEEIFDYQRSAYSFILLENLESLSENLYSNTCELTGINLYNKNWLILNLLGQNTTEVDYNCFNSNNELKEFFQILPKFSPKAGRETIVFDDYFNFSSNNIIYSILKNTPGKLKCFTRLERGSDKNEKRRSVKDYFGNSKAKVFFTNNRTLTHERKIAIHDLIIEFTHDFDSINLANRNWTIYLKINNSQREELDIKIAAFRE